MQSKLVLGLWLAVTVLNAATSIQDELSDLKMPLNQAPKTVASEKLYAVQSRFNPLSYKNEISVGAAKQFNSNGFLTSGQLDLAYRFYFTDRYFVAASGSYVFNDLSDSGKSLLQNQNLVPDLAYAKYRGDLLVGANLFYGKFRITMDEIFYFDQYLAMGPGLAALSTSTTWSVVGDVGFVFWFGDKMSFRLGLKDVFYKEKRMKSESFVHNLLGRFEVGVVL